MSLPKFPSAVRHAARGVVALTITAFAMEASAQAPTPPPG
jgi:hypothetical protein